MIPESGSLTGDPSWTLRISFTDFEGHWFHQRGGTMSPGTSSPGSFTNHTSVLRIGAVRVPGSGGF